MAHLFDKIMTSSFLGCLSLEVGAVTIAILHVIGGVLFQIFGIPSYDDRLWSPMFYIAIITGLFSLVAIVTRNSGCLFPFVCSQYILTMLLGFQISSQIYSSWVVTYRFKEDAILIFCDLIALAVMTYCFRIINIFFDSLIIENIEAARSVTNADQTKEVPRFKKYINNCVFQLSENQKFTKLENMECP